MPTQYALGTRHPREGGDPGFVVGAASAGAASAAGIWGCLPQGLFSPGYVLPAAELPGWGF